MHASLPARLCASVLLRPRPHPLLTRVVSPSLAPLAIGRYCAAPFMFILQLMVPANPPLR